MLHCWLSGWAGFLPWASPCGRSNRPLPTYQDLLYADLLGAREAPVGEVDMVPTFTVLWPSSSVQGPEGSTENWEGALCYGEGTLQAVPRGKHFSTGCYVY